MKDPRRNEPVIWSEEFVADGAMAPSDIEGSSSFGPTEDGERESIQAIVDEAAAQGFGSEYFLG